ncbi:MAG: fimbria/pilus outer membrane usher protein [Telluria sp.]
MLAGALPALPLRAAPAAAPLSVTIVDTDGDNIQLRLWMPAAFEPDIALVNEGNGKLLVSWPAAVELRNPLPLPEPGGRAIEAFRQLSMRAHNGQTELELVLAQPMQGVMLRREGEAWVVQMSPAPPGARVLAQPAHRPAASPAPAAPKAPTQSPTLPPPAAPAPAQSQPPASLIQAPVPARQNAGPAPAAQVAAPAPAPPSGAAEELLLDLAVNDRPVAEIVRVELLPGGALLVPASAWEQARLAVPGPPVSMSDGSPAYRLDALPGASFSIDRQALRLQATVPANAFVTARLQETDTTFAPPTRPPLGALLNYDVTSTAAGRGAGVTADAMVEGVVFGPAGSLVNSALLRNNAGPRRRAERLDTYWRYDMPDRLQTLVVGDTIGVDSGWSRPVRYAGIRWGRDFTMRPGFVTMPQVAVAAEAALPSTVDVVVNNARRMSQAVPPGPFELPDVPVVTGAGQINVIVRDVLGNERVVTQNYYSSSRLLAPGLTDFSMEAGRMRFGYGSDSHYAQQFAAGTFRLGLARDLTAELRGEWQGERKAAGVEVSSLLGSWAIAHVAVARSQGSTTDPAEHGNMMSAGLERTTVHGGAAISYEQADRQFAPFGEAASPLAPLSRPRQRLLATMGGPVVAGLNAGVSYVRQVRWDGERVAIGAVALSAPLSHGMSLNLSVNRELLPPFDWRAGLLLSIPLSVTDHAYVQAERSSAGRPVATAAVSRTAPAGIGWGWNLQASTQDSQRARASVRYNSNWSELYGEAATAPDGSPAARAEARGSVGVLSGMPFLSRPIGEGSFAVVDVGGLPGVPVLRSHQVIATTDGSGRALIPGLLPWQKNQIEIDPIALPLDATASSWVQEVTPFAASGATVRFDVKRSRQALLVLRKPDGTPVPSGARARLLPDGAEFVSGLRGEFWLSDLPTSTAKLAVTWTGGACTVELPAGPPDAQPQQIGPLTCAGTSP